MPIDYRIVQDAGAQNPLAGLSGALDGIRKRGMEDQKFAQEQAMSAEELAAKKIANLSARDKSRLTSTMYAIADFAPDLEAGNIEGVRNKLTSRRQNLMQRMANGEAVDTTETDQALKLLDTDPEQLKAITKNALTMGERLGIIHGNTTASGGVLGSLTQQIMDNTGVDYATAFSIAKQGLGTGMTMQGGQVVPMGGVPQARGEIKYGETAGGEQAKIDTKGREDIPKQYDTIKSLELSQANMDATLDDAEKLAGWWETGATGALLSKIPGTNSFDLSKTLDTIKANVGFEKLQEMRDNSPTGGALGQVTEREIEFLQAVISSLEQSQSKDVFLKNLRKVRIQYKESMKNIKEAYSRDAERFGANSVPKFFTDFVNPFTDTENQKVPPVTDTQLNAPQSGGRTQPPDISNGIAIDGNSPNAGGGAWQTTPSGLKYKVVQ